jgi:putative phage-type endonuclease
MRLVVQDQQSDEWRLWRSKGLGGSDAAIILGISKYSTPEQLMADKLQHWNWSVRKTESKKTGAQARGIRLEPVARDAYIDFTGIVIHPACVIHQELDWMRASLDGLSEDQETPVEIKCINVDFHQDAVAGSVPSVYWPQVQHQLAVAGTKHLHYWSYSENKVFTKGEQRALVTVKPHWPYINRLIAKERTFWEELIRRARDLGIFREKITIDLTSSESVVK